MRLNRETGSSDADGLMTLSVNARTFDPAQNLVWEDIESTITLKADPEGASFQDAQYDEEGPRHGCCCKDR